MHPVFGTAVRMLGVSVVLAVSMTSGEAQTVRGHLLEAGTDRPIDLGLLILLAESGDSVTYGLTDLNGYFSVTASEPGSYELLGSGLGYEESRAGVFELGMGGEVTVEFRLIARPMPIDALLVTLDREVLEHKLVRTGFVRRYQRNAGGKFLTPFDIERSSGRTTEAFLQTVPGVEVVPVHVNEGGASSVARDMVLISARGRPCRPAIYVDGLRVSYDPESGETLSSYAPLHAVQAIEVYRGAAEVPVEYNATRGFLGQELCGVVVIWLK